MATKENAKKVVKETTKNEVKAITTAVKVYHLCKVEEEILSAVANK